MTITIRLPDQLEAQLRARLDAKDVPLSEYVRQAIVEKLEREPDAETPSIYELWKQHFTGWGSGETDRSERVEEILGAELDAKHRGR